MILAFPARIIAPQKETHEKALTSSKGAKKGGNSIMS